ncbi:sporulation protein [Melghirimyces profundicolus]|nr:sporulation protein [Melghirimyces profundicolus]
MLLASLGVGGAKIDLVLEQEEVRMGETITGEIHLKGGDVDQSIRGFSVDFCVESQLAGIEIKECVCSIPVTDEAITLKAGEERTYPFSFTCPEFLPFSYNLDKGGIWSFDDTQQQVTNTKFYFKTNLDIALAKDVKDRDTINVLPAGIVKNFLEACWRLGFFLRGESYWGERYGKAQSFHLVPRGWMRGKFDEIKFVYIPSRTKSEMEVGFEVDRSTTGIKGVLYDKLDMDEVKGGHIFSKEDLATVEKAEETIKYFILEKAKKLKGVNLY